jgi:transposase
MRIGYICSYQFFLAGTNRDGWFTNANLIEQIDSIIYMIKALHPNKELVFAFDNSMTHRAKPPDALDAWSRNLSDGGKNAKDMRNGWFDKITGHDADGTPIYTRVVQEMQHPNKICKGLKTILEERNLFTVQHGRHLKRLCNACKNGITIETRTNENWYIPRCCAVYVLSQQPDFLQQKEWLTETIENYEDCSIIFYPKYHCELNFIEMIWGWIKSYHRRGCTYNFADLKQGLPDTIDNRIPISFIRRAQNRCFRYMEHYRKGLIGEKLEYAIKKYKSHRLKKNNEDPGDN